MVGDEQEQVAPRGPRRLAAGSALPVRAAKATSLVIDELRRLIMTVGESGMLLPSERALMEDLGVSRPTLREALRVLEAEGLVRIRRGTRGGAVIQEPSVLHLAPAFGFYLQRRNTRLEDVFQVRSALEPLAARLAAGRGAELSERFEQFLVDERRMVGAQESDEQASQTLVTFHHLMLEHSGNETLLAVGLLLEEVVRHHAQESLAWFGSRGREARREALTASHDAHTHIAEAIVRGDGDRAERLARVHLEELFASTRATVGEYVMAIASARDRHRKLIVG